MKRIDNRGSFNATGDDGRTYKIMIYVTILDAATFEDPNGECDGLSELQTSSGQHVNRIEQGRYEILQTGMGLTSTDPKAL